MGNRGKSGLKRIHTADKNHKKTAVILWKMAVFHMVHHDRFELSTP